MIQIKITQLKSTIHRPERQKRTIRALGLGKINRSVVKIVNPAILGMVEQVSHLVKVERIS
jgi:large subunit ribosomal protein L30